MSDDKCGLVFVGCCCSASVMSDSSFASPTAIWGEHWRVDPFASAEKEISISFEEVKSSLLFGFFMCCSMTHTWTQ